MHVPDIEGLAVMWEPKMHWPSPELLLEIEATALARHCSVRQVVEELVENTRRKYGPDEEFETHTQRWLREYEEAT